jgi:hypothetical protein
MAQWFAPKRYGYGCGLPTCWQGWLVLGVYAALILGSSYWLADKPLPLLSIVIPATLLFVIICARTSGGSWRWRWGDDD